MGIATAIDALAKGLTNGNPAYHDETVKEINKTSPNKYGKNIEFYIMRYIKHIVIIIIIHLLIIVFIRQEINRTRPLPPLTLR